MTGQGFGDVFLGHGFVQGLSERHRSVLAAAAKPFKAAMGEMLAREGEAAKCFYLVQAGHVVLGLPTPDRGVLPIQTVGPGEVVGWSWLVPPHRWQFDARVIDTVQAVALNALCLRGKCDEDHELGYQFLQRLVAVISGRLAGTRLQLLDMYR